VKVIFQLGKFLTENFVAKNKKEGYYFPLPNQGNFSGPNLLLLQMH